MIITVNPKRPLEFTAKGTPRRNVCLKAYEKEIDAVYEAVKDSSQTNISVPESWTAENAMAFVDIAVKSVMRYPIAVDQDIFLQGCDRLVPSFSPSSLSDILSVYRQLGSEIVYYALFDYQRTRRKCIRSHSTLCICTQLYKGWASISGGF
jgi:hypothetical protein